MKRKKTLLDKLDGMGLKVRYNTFLKRIESELPDFCGRRLLIEEENILSRTNLAIIRDCLLKEGDMKRVNITEIELSIRAMSSKRRYHPILEYFKGLKDVRYKRGQVSGYFTRYFGVEDTEFTRRVSELFFVSAVKRVMEPGIKYDCMLILNGAQGIGKSYSLQLLAGRDWYMDITLSEFMDTKIRMEKTRGAWIVESAELIGYQQKSLDLLKDSLMTNVDQYRLAYRKEKETVPRSYVLIGTTNNKNFLKVKERRFIILLCNSTREEAHKNLEEISLKRDELWAEALDLSERYKNLDLNPEMFDRNIREQSNYLYTDDMVDKITEYVENSVSSFVENESIWSYLEITNIESKQRLNKKLANTMHLLGYESIRRNRKRGWVRSRDS